MKTEEGQKDLEALLADENQLKSLKEFMQMNFVYDSAIGIMKTRLEVLQREYSLAHGYNPIHSVESRLKKPMSIAKKLRRKNLEITIDNIRRNLKDVAGMRVICNYKNDVYTIAEVLKRQLDVSVLEEKDYIKNPKENGYRSYHMVVTVPVYFTNRTENVPIEIQIRTIAMDFWASLEHQLRYKSDVEIPEHMSDDLKKCADVIAETDQEMQRIAKELKVL